MTGRDGELSRGRCIYRYILARLLFVAFFFFCQWMWMSALDLLCAAYHTIWLRCIEWHLNGNSYTHYFSSTGSVMPGASFSPLSSFLLSTPQWHWIAAIWQTRPGSLREWQVPKVLPLYILKQWPTVISLWLWPVNILGSYTVVWDLRRFLVWSQSGGRWGQDEDERESRGSSYSRWHVRAPSVPPWG